MTPFVCLIKSQIQMYLLCESLRFFRTHFGFKIKSLIQILLCVSLRFFRILCSHVGCLIQYKNCCKNPSSERDRTRTYNTRRVCCWDHFMISCLLLCLLSYSLKVGRIGVEPIYWFSVAVLITQYNDRVRNRFGQFLPKN